MASHINNVTIASSYSSPKIKYDVSYTATRTSNSKVKYKFKIVPWLDGDTSATQFLSGLSLKCYITVADVKGSVELKSTSESWVNNTADQKRTAKYITIECGSTTANAKQTVRFQVTRPDGTGNSGKVDTSDYYVTSPALLYTDCTAPTTFTISPNPFKTSVTLKWSGAKAGTTNAIESYYIQYCTSSNNSTWGSWTGLTTVESTSTSGSKTIDMSSKVTNNHYVKFRIRTQGEAGSSYYSDYKSSSSIQRKNYTDCTAPTSFTVSPTTFETSVSFSWSGAKAGTNNSISSYYIQYCKSSDNSTWGDWTGLATVGSTSTSGSYKKDISSLITRGHYVKFRIQTRGSAGSSYYSDYKGSSSIRRNPYTKCSAPTTFTVASNNFDTSVTLSWSGASAGTNNTIKSYLIQYSISDTSSDFTSWTTYKTISTTKTSYSITYNVSSIVDRKEYIQFRIKTQGSAGTTYYSDYKTSNAVRRNPYTKCGAPTTITLASNKDLKDITHTDVFESSITINLFGATAGTNNAIKGYGIQYRTSDNKSTWGDWGTYTTRDSTATSYSFEMFNIATNLTSRGQYVQFRVKTVGTIDGYDSDYITSGIMRKNSQPSNVTQVDTLVSLEYSYGDDITIRFPKASDVDNNIYKYLIRLYPDVSDTSIYYDYEVISDADFPTFTLDSTDANYQEIANNQQLKFAVKSVDVFGIESDSYISSNIISRYDINGVAIGINGKWANCQLYYAPIGGVRILADSVDWTNGGINSNTGLEMGSSVEVRTDFVETKGVTITRCTETYNNVFSPSLLLYYYDENKQFQQVTSGFVTINHGLSVDENYKYVRIVMYDSNNNIPQSDLYKTVDVRKCEWIEQDVSAGINNAWVDSFDGM